MQNIAVCQKSVLLLTLIHTLCSYEHSVLLFVSLFLSKRPCSAFPLSQGVFQTSCAVFSALQLQNNVPAGAPLLAAFACHGVQYKLNFSLNGERGFFKLVLEAKFSLVTCMGNKKVGNIAMCHSSDGFRGRSKLGNCRLS